MSQGYNDILSGLKRKTGFQVGGASVPTYKELQRAASNIYHGGTRLDEDTQETPITVTSTGLKTPLVLRYGDLKITMELDTPLPSSSVLSCVRQGSNSRMGGRMLWSTLIGTVDKTSMRGTAVISLYPKEGVIVARDPAGNKITIVVNTGQPIRHYLPLGGP